MKETVLDVLMYLFDQYVEDTYDNTSDQDVLRTQLREAGFEERQVNKAFDWLESLALHKDSMGGENSNFSNSIRVYTDRELQKLGTECRGLLLFLEQSGILDFRDREFVIERVMVLDADEIDLQQLKWVVLMVLLNQPGKEAAYTWMEDMVMDDLVMSIH